jgi:hypothetical protein
LSLDTTLALYFLIGGYLVGTLSTVLFTRFFELVHMWKMVNNVVYQLLLMCVLIVESISFINELKIKTMRLAGLSNEQIETFQLVWDEQLTNWKDTVIMVLVNAAPSRFRQMLEFSNWNEAIKYLEDTRANSREAGK